MDEQNLNPNEPIQNSKYIWITIIAVLISTIIVGGGVYAWQKSNLQAIEQSSQRQITDLQNQIIDLKKLAQLNYSRNKEPTQPTSPASQAADETAIDSQNLNQAVTPAHLVPESAVQPIPSAPLKADELSARITVASKNPTQGISGMYNGLSTSLVFSSVQSGPYERKAEFKTKDDSVVVSIVASETGVSKITVNNISWEFNTTNTLTEKEKETLHIFGGSEVARAIVETTAYLYWKAPEYPLIKYRLTFVQLYQALAEFYPIENKKLVQPAGSLSGECKGLENICQLITEQAIFGCWDGKKVQDVLPLIDGLPIGCNVQ